MASESQRSAQRPNWFNPAVITLMALVTVISGFTSFLQNDATGRSEVATRNSQRYAITEMERRLIVQQTQNYDAYVLRQLYGLTWEIGLSRDPLRDERLRQMMEVTAKFSPLTQPPYTPASLDADPNWPQYMAEMEFEPTLWQQRRKAAALEAEAWGSKAAVYVTALSLLAVSLFLFGLALTLQGCVRVGFAVLGLLVAVLTSAWVTFTLVTVPRVRSDETMRIYAEGVSNLLHAEVLYGLDRSEEAQAYFNAALERFDEALEREPRYIEALEQRGFAQIEHGLQLILAEDEAAGGTLVRAGVRDYELAYRYGSREMISYWNLGFSYYLLGEYEQSLLWTDRAIAAAPQQVTLYINRALALIGLGRTDEAFADLDLAFRRAAREEVSSTNYYFRTAIFNITHFTRLWPDPDVEEVLKRLKEAYVSLRYREGARVEPTGATIESLAFGAKLDEDNNVTDLAEAFPAGTQAVYVQFNYADLPPSAQIAAMVYVNNRVDETLTAVQHAILDQEGTAWIRIATPFINSYGLVPGRYRVDLHVEGELLASGEFVVGP